MVQKYTRLQFETRSYYQGLKIKGCEIEGGTVMIIIMMMMMITMMIMMTVMVMMMITIMIMMIYDKFIADILLVSKVLAAGGAYVGQILCPLSCWRWKSYTSCHVPWM